MNGNRVSSQGYSDRETGTTSKRIWKTAVDPKSGKTYYYDTITRETQWAKPPELATSAEKAAIQAKKQKQIDFFTDMEANIVNTLRSGHLPGEKSSDNEDDDDVFELSADQENNLKFNLEKLPSNLPPLPLKKGGLVRTISSMDENVLEELTLGRGDSNMINLDKNIPIHSKVNEVIKYFDDESEDRNLCPSKIGLARRNTGSTIYVGTTMSAPDIDATIKCVCGVFRAHMIQSARDSRAGIDPIPFEEYDVFNDDYVTEMMGLSIQDGNEYEVPSFDIITQFYRDIFRKSQMESDCIIMSLIYIERLIKETNGGVRPRNRNWKSLLFASMIMASKVWDDLSMWNSDFSKICASFTLQRVNQLEISMLSVLKYSVKVPASEYAKYYFLLRSMIIRSGLGNDDTISNQLALDVEGAKKLELFSSNYEKSLFKNLLPKKGATQRSKSLSEVDNKSSSKTDQNDLRSSGKQGRSNLVSLEQVVKMG